MVNLDLPLSHKENADLIYIISYFYTVLIAALIWSIWRFVKSILSLKPKNIKAQVEKRLARHYAERRRYRQTLQQQQQHQKITEVESQQHQQIQTPAATQTPQQMLEVQTPKIQSPKKASKTKKQKQQK